MVHNRRLAAAAALVISTASLAVFNVPAAHAAGVTTLYVDNTTSACSDSGSGTAAAPFCTIQAAANVVAPGQTVLIGGVRTSYNEDVNVTTSGTPTAPITFAAAGTYFTVAQQTHNFTLTGVSNIVIRGLAGTSSDDNVLISGSSHITIENSVLRQSAPSAPFTIAGVHVTGASNAVTIERNRFESYNTLYGGGVRIDGGSSGTVVATNDLSAFTVDDIVVAGASGTEITGNTIGNNNGGSCGRGIAVLIGSTNTSIENNAIKMSNSNVASCPATAQDLVVSADSAATTTAKYNVLSTAGGVVTPYNWAGTTYTTAAAFQAATGQGAQDAVTLHLDLSITAIPTSSPLLDSADPNAPGKTSTDIYGNSGYDDRGALEYEEYTASSMNIGFISGQHIWAQVDLKGVPWGSAVTESFNWGDGTSTGTYGVGNAGISTDYTNWLGGQHTYVSRGTYTVTETLTDAAGTKTLTSTFTTNGSTYTPVAPTRVLDTRHGIGTGGVSQPVAGGSSIAINVTNGVPGAPAASSITAVVLNVTVTAPASGGYVTAYPDGTTRPTSSNINFAAGGTVPNLVTVKVGADGKVALFNGSAGSTQLVADVEGYYTATTAGSGFLPVSPTRLLDTRNGTGTGGSTNPVPAGGTIRLKIDGNGPVPASGVTAVALNVTVTRPTAGGYITVYPGGAPLPKASNLNFSPGETVPNLVIVPVGANGTVSLTNGSAGTAALVADVFGYYKSTGGDAFVPIDPERILDTRTGLGQGSPVHVVAADGDQIVSLSGTGQDLLDSEVLVMNVTVTNPAAGGYIAVYPFDTSPTVSNLNFSAGETVSNLAITVGGGGNAPVLHNGSAGTTNLVADAFGFFS